MINCQVCKAENLTIYIDGKTKYGPWANMCIHCHSEIGCGFGPGKGQQYQYLDGQYKKIRG